MVAVSPATGDDKAVSVLLLRSLLPTTGLSLVMGTGPGELELLRDASKLDLGRFTAVFALERLEDLVLSVDRLVPTSWWEGTVLGSTSRSSDTARLLASSPKLTSAPGSTFDDSVPGSRACEFDDDDGGGLGEDVLNGRDRPGI